MPERFVGCLRRFGTKPGGREKTINQPLWSCSCGLFWAALGVPPAFGTEVQPRIYANAGMPRSVRHER